MRPASSPRTPPRLSARREARGPGVRISSAPSACSELATLDRHRVGHDQRALVAFRRGDERQSDSGVAARRLDDRGARLQLAAPSPPLRPSRCAMRSFTDDSGLNDLQLDDHFGRSPFGHVRLQAHHWSVADQLRDVVVDLSVACRSPFVQNKRPELPARVRFDS